MAELSKPVSTKVFGLNRFSLDQTETSVLLLASSDYSEDFGGKSNTLTKRFFDFLISLCFLICLLPLMCLIALVIKLDSPGPVLFRQPRIGFQGKPFTILKFRSMRHDMADLLADRQTSRGDLRVTRLGQYLRRWSLDELPQLLNVIRGEMSLVGPRPHAPNTRADGRFLWDVSHDYQKRHIVRPGLTGWAQINGARGEIKTVADLNRRVELDVEYIERWSIRLDVKILFLTFAREIIKTSAY